MFHTQHNHQADPSDNLLSSIISSSNSDEARRIRKIVIVGCVINACLMILKLGGGYLGHSDALMADGYHSLNDFAADLIMLVFIGISFRPTDHKYTYGYGKFETFSTFIISIFLLLISFHIMEEGIHTIVEYSHGVAIEKPDIWTVVIIAVAMCAKEFLFRYYRFGARKNNCTALLTNAWHHRSDAVASVATLIGVAGAHFLGENWRILDPIVSILLSIFILVAAIRMLRPSFRELMESVPNPEIIPEATDVISSIVAVKRIDALKCRKNGHCYIFDIVVAISPRLTIEEGSEVALMIEKALKNKFGESSMISISTVPFSSGRQMQAGN